MVVDASIVSSIDGTNETSSLVAETSRDLGGMFVGGIHGRKLEMG